MTSRPSPRGRHLEAVTLRPLTAARLLPLAYCRSRSRSRSRSKSHQAAATSGAPVRSHQARPCGGPVAASVRAGRRPREGGSPARRVSDPGTTGRDAWPEIRAGTLINPVTSPGIRVNRHVARNPSQSPGIRGRARLPGLQASGGGVACFKAGPTRAPRLPPSADAETAEGSRETRAGSSKRVMETRAGS